jgi:hypothetical protein
MIKINLLPKELSGSRKGSGAFDAGGSLLVAVVLFLLFGLDLLVGGYVFYNYTTAKTAIDRVTVEAAAVEAELIEVEKEFNELTMSMEKMEELISVAKSLDPPERLLWCRKLNMLPLLIPEGVFLTQVQVTQSVRSLETQASLDARNAHMANPKLKKLPPPAKVVAPVITQTMNLEGVAHVDMGTETQRLQHIIQFYRNLQGAKHKLPFDNDETRFLDGFTPFIDTAAVRSTQFEGREVSGFQFSLKTKDLWIK